MFYLRIWVCLEHAESCVRSDSALRPTCCRAMHAHTSTARGSGATLIGRLSEHKALASRELCPTSAASHAHRPRLSDALARWSVATPEPILAPSNRIAKIFFHFNYRQPNTLAVRINYSQIMRCHVHTSLAASHALSRLCMRCLSQTRRPAARHRSRDCREIGGLGC